MVWGSFDCGDSIMAFGLDQTGKVAVDSFIAAAPGIIDKLATAGHTLEADAITSLHTALTDGIAQEADVVAKAEAPIVAQLTRACDLLQRLLDEGIPITAQIGGKQPAKAV